MSKRQPKHVVTVAPWNNIWCIAVDNDVGMLMSGAKKAIVVAAARGIALELKAELVIKDKRGRIRQRDSHGHDPRSRKG